MDGGRVAVCGSDVGPAHTPYIGMANSVQHDIKTGGGFPDDGTMEARQNQAAAGSLRPWKPIHQSALKGLLKQEGITSRRIS